MIVKRTRTCARCPRRFVVVRKANGKWPLRTLCSHCVSQSLKDAHARRRIAEALARIEETRGNKGIGRPAHKCINEAEREMLDREDTPICNPIVAESVINYWRRFS